LKKYGFVRQENISTERGKAKFTLYDIINAVLDVLTDYKFTKPSVLHKIHFVLPELTRV